jgi:hypothetical protein
MTNVNQVEWANKQEVRIGMAEAMRQGRAFSIVKDKTVQAGVYLNYTQKFFQQYKMVH